MNAQVVRLTAGAEFHAARGAATDHGASFSIPNEVQIMPAAHGVGGSVSQSPNPWNAAVRSMGGMFGHKAITEANPLGL